MSGGGDFRHRLAAQHRVAWDVDALCLAFARGGEVDQRPSKRRLPLYRFSRSFQAGTVQSGA